VEVVKRGRADAACRITGGRARSSSTRRVRGTQACAKYRELRTRRPWDPHSVSHPRLVMDEFPTLQEAPEPVPTLTP
jgi:hypothetical protein